VRCELVQAACRPGTTTSYGEAVAMRDSRTSAEYLSVDPRGTATVAGDGLIAVRGDICACVAREVTVLSFLGSGPGGSIRSEKLPTTACSSQGPSTCTTGVGRRFRVVSWGKAADALSQHLVEDCLSDNEDARGVGRDSWPAHGRIQAEDRIRPCPNLIREHARDPHSGSFRRGERRKVSGTCLKHRSPDK
jgi:hypothetical protein